MADFKTVAIFAISGENSYFPKSKQTLKVQLSLDVLGKMSCFTHGEQAIVNSCYCSTRLHLVLQTSHSLEIARFPHS